MAESGEQRPGSALFSPRAGKAVSLRSGEVGHPFPFFRFGFGSLLVLGLNQFGMGIKVRVRVLLFLFPFEDIYGFHCCSYPELIAGFRVRFRRETEPSFFNPVRVRVQPNPLFLLDPHWI